MEFLYAGIRFYAINKRQGTMYFLHLYKKREEKNLCSFETGWEGSWVLTLTFWNANASF